MNQKIISKYRVLYVNGDTIYASRNYKIYKSTDDGINWTLDGKLEDKKHTFLGSISRLLARLLRIEISDLVLLNDGSRVLIAKKGIFVAKPNSKRYVRTFKIPRGKPMNICLDKGSRDLYFGEYISNGYFAHNEREEVNIYTSKDNGYSWEICYTFPKNTTRHVHGIYYDHYEDKVWFTTGDKGDECMIGYTTDGFKTIEIVKQGGQRYRAVRPLFYKDYIVYGTDTHIEQNHIYAFDRKSGIEEDIVKVQGSVISAVQVGKKACLSTAVEPSECNTDKNVYIWYTENGREWECIYKAKHDGLSLRYFQFARFQFPEGAIHDDRIYMSGSALTNFDGKTAIITV